MARDNEGVIVDGDVSNLVVEADPDLEAGTRYIFGLGGPRGFEGVVYIGRFADEPDAQTNKKDCYMLTRIGLPAIGFEIGEAGIWAWTDNGQQASVVIQEEA